MNRSFAALERQRLARCRLLAELRYRRLPRPGGWSHCGEQFGTEPTSLALLALHSSSSASTVPRQELEPLLACQRPNGLWPAVGDGAAGVSFWASAIAVNTLMILGAAPETFAGALDSFGSLPAAGGFMAGPFEVPALRPASSVRSDEVRLGVGSRHRELGGADIDGPDYAGTRKETGTDPRQRTAEQASPRSRDAPRSSVPGGGWNAGNAVVYGVPLRPHVDATALALAALRVHHNLPIVRDSLTWILNRIDCPSPYSLAWVILAAAAYKEVRSDVSPALDVARDRLAMLVDDPKELQDTSTIALAALALAPETSINPFEVRT